MEEEPEVVHQLLQAQAGHGPLPVLDVVLSKLALHQAQTGWEAQGHLGLSSVGRQRCPSLIGLYCHGWNMLLKTAFQGLPRRGVVRRGRGPRIPQRTDPSV